jgi:hypothetical protein
MGAIGLAAGPTIAVAVATGFTTGFAARVVVNAVATIIATAGSITRGFIISYRVATRCPSHTTFLVSRDL